VRNVLVGLFLGLFFGDFWRGDVGVGGCEGCTESMMGLLLRGGGGWLVEIVIVGDLMGWD